MKCLKMEETALEQVGRSCMRGSSRAAFHRVCRLLLLLLLCLMSCCFASAAPREAGRGGQRARACVSDHLAAVVCLAARASFDGRVLVWVWRGLVCVQYVILANGARGRAAVALIQQAVANPHLFHFGELVDHDNIAALDGTLPSLSPRVLPRNYDKKTRRGKCSALAYAATCLLCAARCASMYFCAKYETMHCSALLDVGL
jgi:hypothetical protein